MIFIEIIAFLGAILYNKTARKIVDLSKKPCSWGLILYKKETQHQFDMMDFNQALGFQIDLNNRWVKKAKVIPWATIELHYARLFPSKTGNPAISLRAALGESFTKQLC